MYKIKITICPEDSAPERVTEIADSVSLEQVNDWLANAASAIKCIYAGMGASKIIRCDPNCLPWNQKIPVIKDVRRIMEKSTLNGNPPGIGLKDAKDFVEGMRDLIATDEELRQLVSSPWNAMKAIQVV